MPIVILGTDALLAAAPATPVQLAHACMRAGYASVIPASWGDELIAVNVIRRLAGAGDGPAIQCSCPIVAHRLLSAGGDLRPVLVTLVSPPVAIARYVRALSQPQVTRVTYVGGCPGALDDSIDIRMTPDAFMALLAERGIVVDEQPRVFESIIPPDRRRYRSQPGGVPAVDALWSELGSRALVEIEGEDFVAEIAQHLLNGKSALIDASVRLGCVCSGAVGTATPAEARSAVLAMEPPRASTPVVEERAPIDLDLPVPAASRTPIDVVAVPRDFAADPPAPSSRTGADMPLGHRISPVKGVASITEPRPFRASTTMTRPIVTSPASTLRAPEAKTLPRTYVARRRSSPKGIPAVSLSDDPPPSTRKAASGEEPPAAIAATPTIEHTPQRGSLDTPLTLRQVVLIVVATIAITVAVSTIVSVIVGRSFLRPADVSSTR
ncbi:MAG TPA: hypothetical protein VHB25_12945 [Gemmatimonadaceae bacterium]|nr:hypothetical protein [Gemmatimonadaceae bacterium]